MSEVSKYQKRGNQLHKVINRALLDKERVIIDSRRLIYAL